MLLVCTATMLARLEPYEVVISGFRVNCGNYGP